MFNDFRTAISLKRLESYRQNGKDDLDTVSRCLWNVSLCEAFYPSLQLMEVGLRNAIHSALSFSYRTPLWFKEPFLCQMCKEDVVQAENELSSEGKDPADPDHLVSSFRFGFWVRLFGKHYQVPLWNNKTFLIRTFPHAKATERTRSVLAERVDKIRRFRNRVFHHESILKYNLGKRHAEIVEFVGFVNPALSTTLGIIDRFPLVHSTAYFQQIETNLKIHCPRVEE